MHHLIICQLTLTIKIVNKSEFGTLSKSLGTEPIRVFKYSNIQNSNSQMYEC